jgi:RNA polymerase sigma factor (sigma-70 family)
MSELHDPQLSFGLSIKELRHRQGWSRAELIRHLWQYEYDNDPERNLFPGWSEAWLARLEQGVLVQIRFNTIKAMASVLRCTLEEQWNLVLLLYPDLRELLDGVVEARASPHNILVQRSEADNLANAFRRLTPREQEIVCLSAKRKTSREIAELLCINKESVDVYWVRVCRKMNIEGRREVLLKLQEYSLLER